MNARDNINRILAVAGTALIWLAILAPALFAVTRLTRTGSFLFDFLLPAEIFPLPLAGGILLLIAALRARSRWKWIGCSLGVVVGALACALILAQVTGLASGETEPAGPPWAAVLALFAVFWLALIALGAGGILLARDAFASRRPATGK